MAKDSKQPWQVWLDRRGRVSWLRVVTLIILLLPAAKALIEANRGALQISSHPHEGTLVEVIFPPTRVLAE